MISKEIIEEVKKRLVKTCIPVVIYSSLIVLFLFASCNGPLAKNQQEPAVVITTISDFHGQLEPAYVWGQDKTLQEQGGVSRLFTLLNSIRSEYQNKVLFFGSGDYFVEDFRVGKYFSAFGGQAIADFLNMLAIDASTIGNHEFDFGMESADKALACCKFPLIATNLKNPEILSSNAISKKLIVQKNGFKLGILGLMLTDPKGYGFSHDVSSAQRDVIKLEEDLYGVTQAAVNELSKQDKVDFVIVLSHLGVEGDKLLAEKVDGIDVICGGHDHAVIKKGQEIVTNKPDGSQTIIVHPGDRGIYVGVMKLWPKQQGKLTYDWDLLEVNASIVQDQQCEQKLQYYKDLLPNNLTITTSTEPIDTSKHNLRTQENSFANFVADIIKEHFEADIVLLNGSSFRGRGILPPGSVTESALDDWFPFKDNTLIKVKASGKVIKQALELGVADLPGESRNLLHPSGLVYHVDLTKQSQVLQKNDMHAIVGIKENGARTIYAALQKVDGSLEPLRDDQEYFVIITAMMIQKQHFGAFFMFAQLPDLEDTKLTEKELLRAYLKRNTTISPNKLGRIKFV
ncbi:MAG: 5'-nucleotidase C-terminal domain-containing protein [bacterium]